MSRTVNAMFFIIFSSLLTFHFVDADPCFVQDKTERFPLSYNCNGEGSKKVKQVPKRPPAIGKVERLLLQNNLIEVFKVDSFETWSAIVELNADDNPLKTIEDGAFLPLSKLRNLSIKYANLVVNEGLTPQVFKPIPSLRLLVMRANSLKVIPDNFFRYLPKLEILDIGNQRGGLKLGKSPFAGIESLKKLLIDENNIRFLPENIFPSSLTFFIITNNILQCDCNLRWILKKFRVIHVIPSCAGPTALINAWIHNLQRDDFQCKPEIKSKSMDESVYAEDSIRLFCDFHSDPRGTESWLKDGAPLDPESTRILIHPLTNGSVTGKMEIEIKTVNSNDAGEWECQVGNKAGNASAKIHIKVLQPAGIFTGLAIGILCFCIVSAVGLYMFIRHRRGNFGGSEGGRLIPLPQR